MSLVRDVWDVLTPRQRLAVLWGQLLSVLMALSTVIGIASIMPFFAVLGDPSLVDRTPLLHRLHAWLQPPDTHAFVAVLGIAFMAAAFTASLINITGSYILARLAASIGADLQTTLLEEYLLRPYVFHAAVNSAVLFKNIMHETTRATHDVLQNIFILFTNGLAGICIVLSVTLLNPAVATTMLLGLAGGYSLIYIALRNRLLRAGQIQSRLFAQQTQLVNESLGAIKEVNLLRIQNFFVRRFETLSHTFARSLASTFLIAQSPKYLMECISIAGLIMVALFAHDRGNGLGSWLGQLTFLAFAAYRLLPTLQQAFGALVKIRTGRAGFLTIAPHLKQARNRRTFTAVAQADWRIRPQREIRLDKVAFRYGENRRPAVDDVTLSLPACSAIGLIGANGSGKTTLVDLLSGLLIPDHGTISVDGVPLDEANRTAWQSRIAYVPQNVYLLDTSIAQNIALGVPASAIDPARLTAAAQLAQLDLYVESLPRKYEHRVGERGMQLSGGQRQRIGIARALYADASVLVLDEATNSLDGLTERELISTLLNLRGRYTVIVIAHDLRMVRGCDVVVEMDEGRVVSQGQCPDRASGFRPVGQITADR